MRAEMFYEKCSRTAISGLRAQAGECRAYFLVDGKVTLGIKASTLLIKERQAQPLLSLTATGLRPARHFNVAAKPLPFKRMIPEAF
jgi:hypothetical protein